MRFNINAKCTVNLSEYGAHVFNEYLDTIGLPEKLKQRQRREPGPYTTQLWNLFQVFGSVYYLGNPKIPFVNNEIKIEDAFIQANANRDRQGGKGPGATTLA